MQVEVRAPLLRRIHDNGDRALRHSMRTLREDPNRPRNTRVLDCLLGSRLTTLALELLLPDTPGDVRDWLSRQQREELVHCHFRSGPDAPTHLEFAERLGAFHEQVLREQGWPGFFAVMELTGEVMSAGTAFAGRFPDDPHSQDGYFADEVGHIRWPLVLLALHATDGQLAKALEAQERFLALMGVPPL